jgi:hypothetical protein
MTTYLEVDGLSLNIAGAWHINRSLLRLLGGAAKRLEHTTFPYVAGQVAYQPYLDLSVFDLELVVKGDNNVHGTPYADKIAGKIANLVYLRNNLFDLTDITVAATLYMDTGNMTADVQVANAVPVDLGATALVTFDLIVPAGRFEPVGS